MLSYMRNRAKKHTVNHGFAGNNRHIFKVKKDLINGDEHTVILTVSCDCDFMSNKGIASNLSCSHILAVIKYIWDIGKINPVFWINNNAKIQTKRNSVISYVKPMNRKINEIKGSEGGKHYAKKTEICNKLLQEGKQFVTEAEFTTGGIADILVLDDAKVIEIVNTESIESIATKWNKYPNGLKIEVVRC